MIIITPMISFGHLSLHKRRSVGTTFSSRALLLGAFCVRMPGAKAGADGCLHRLVPTADNGCGSQVPLRKITSYTRPRLARAASAPAFASVYYFCFLENGSGYVPDGTRQDFHEYSLADTNALYKYVLKPRGYPRRIKLFPAAVTLLLFLSAGALPPERRNWNNNNPAPAIRIASPIRFGVAF